MYRFFDHQLSHSTMRYIYCRRKAKPEEVVYCPISPPMPRNTIRSRVGAYKCLICQSDEFKFDNLKDLQDHYWGQQRHSAPSIFNCGVNLNFFWRVSTCNPVMLRRLLQDKRDWIRNWKSKKRYIWPLRYERWATVPS